MGIYLNPGNRLFQSAREAKIYIDKSEIIELINETLSTSEGYICMTRPRRFGKTLTANMLAAYYDKSCDSHALFDDLDIAKSSSYEKHLNKYNVIKIDVQGVLDKVGIENFERKFEKEILNDLHEGFPELVSGKENYLFDALYAIYKATGDLFVFIFDEWDCIARNYKDDKAAQKNWSIFLRGMFKNGQATQYIALAYLTGIFPIRKYGSESGLGHFNEFTIVSPLRFSPWVGFTSEDVQRLSDEYHMNIQDMKNWYDGYLIYGEHCYNPSSVVKACINHRCGMYWTKTESFESLRQFISRNFDGLKDKIIRMINGEPQQVNVNSFNNTMYDLNSADDVMTLLIHIGYLGYFENRESAYDDSLGYAFIPNEEVCQIFRIAVTDCGWIEVDKSIRLSIDFMEALFAFNAEKVAQILENIHSECCSILKYNDENSLSCAIGFAAYTAKRYYTVVREMPSGRGFTDIVMIPRPGVNKPAVIIELKWNKDVESAIDQIYKKKYPKGFEAYQGDMVLVAVNYEKEGDCSHSCRMERIAVN